MSVREEAREKAWLEYSITEDEINELTAFRAGYDAGRSDLASLRSLLAGATTIDFEGIARSIQRLKSGRYKVYDYGDREIAGQPELGFETIEQAFAWIQEQGR